MGADASASGARRFRPDIQGLRAVAVLGVLLYHADVPFLGGGFVGVDVFFVISGFLITARLAEDFDRDGRVRFALFYARRVRRLLPAALFVLVASVLAALVWFPPVFMREVWRGAVASALYVPNVLLAADRTNYLAASDPSPFQHYWSLGVEEQFYLLWPLMLAVCWRFARSRRSSLLLLLAFVLISFAACVVVTFRSQPIAFFLLPTRAWEFGAGALVAFALRGRTALVPEALAPVVGWTGVAATIVPMFLFTSTTPFPGYWAAVPVIGTALIILGGATPSGFAPTRALSMRGMLFVGAISYSLYLVHWPALVIIQAAVGYAHPLPLLAKLTIVALCVPVAWLIYRFVERRFQTERTLGRAGQRRSLLVAVISSTTAVAVATAALAYTESRPLHGERSAAPTVVQAPPVVTPFVPSNMTPTIDDVAADLPSDWREGCGRDQTSTTWAPCLYGVPGAPRIVLFGDSHAAQWSPALRAFAETNGYSIEVRAKNSCPSVSAPAVLNGVPFPECEQWRDSVVSTINEDPPALVVLASFGSTDIGITGDRRVAWQTSLESMILSIDAPVVVLADTPDLRATPSVCLSGRLLDTAACGLPREEALDGAGRAAALAAAAATGADYLDLTDYFCDRTMCPPVIGNTLVYRDGDHITATYSTLMGAALDRELAALLE